MIKKIISLSFDVTKIFILCFIMMYTCNGCSNAQYDNEITDEELSKLKPSYEDLLNTSMDEYEVICNLNELSNFKYSLKLISSNEIDNINVAKKATELNIKKYAEEKNIIIPNDIIDYLIVNKIENNQINLFSLYTIKDSYGKIVDNINQNAKPSLVFFFLNDYNYKIEILENFNKIESIFGQDNFNYFILWENDIQIELLEEYDIDLSKNFSISIDAYSYNIPYFFIMDIKNNIQLSENNLTIMIENIVNNNFIPLEKLRENANIYIKKNLIDNELNKKQLIYFYMDKCPDCERTDSIINSEEVKLIYNVTKIYKFNDPIHDIKDNFKLFSSIYNIDWYPSFIIFDNNSYRIINDDYSIKEIKNILLNN